MIPSIASGFYLYVISSLVARKADPDDCSTADESAEQRGRSKEWSFGKGGCKRSRTQNAECR